MAIWKRKQKGDIITDVTLCYSVTVRYNSMIITDRSDCYNSIQLLKLYKKNGEIQSDYIKGINFKEANNEFDKYIKNLEEIGYKNFEKALFELENK